MTQSTNALPKGWREATLGELCDVIADGTHYTPTYVENGVPFYSVENVTRDDFVNVKFISMTEHQLLNRRSHPRRGDILMTRIGSLGETKLLDWDVEASIYVSLALLRPSQEVEGAFLYAYTKSRKFVKAVEDRSLLWAAPKKINMRDVANVPVLLPKDPVEQRMIANVVMTLENYMASLQRLISKKESIKRGMMQQLLTGKARLPDFTKPWNESTLGDVAQINTGQRNNQDKKTGGRYPFFVRSSRVERIDTYSYDCEAILIPGEGSVGSIFHYINGKFEVHQRVYKISHFATGIRGRFLYHYMRQYFGTHAMENSVKATVDSLRLSTFKRFRIKFPSLDEQEAISAVLDDAEEELSALHSRLLMMRDITTGTMQELLTGSTRLPMKGRLE